MARDEATQDARRLRTARFLVLMQQLEDEYGSISAAAAKGLKGSVSESYFHKLLREPKRAISQDKVDAVCRAIGLSHAFFEDPALGDEPDHADHLGDPEPWVEMDDEQGYPAVEAYIAQQAASGDPLDPDHAKELRGFRMATGPEGITVGVVGAIHGGLVVRDAKKALRRPSLNRPVEEDRGQRKLPGR